MSATKILWGQIITVFLIVLTAIWSATQWTASALAYQPELGSPWFMVGDWPVYPPPAFFWWRFSFDAYAPDIFQTGAYIAVSGGFVSIAVAITMSIWRARELKNAETYGLARWASEKEIRKAGLLGDNGVVLGQFGRTYLRHDGPEHVLCYAPTRSGKGVGLVVPSLLTWPGSAIVHDIKGENWTLTAGFRSRHGRVLLFDPTNALSAAYNPLLEVRRGQWEVRDVQNVADVLVDPEGSLERRTHWEKTSHSLLVGAILHVLYAEPDKTLAGVAAFLSDPARPIETTLDRMMATPHLGEAGVHPVIASAARELLNKSDNERSGVLSTAMSFLGLYRDPVVAEVTRCWRIADLVEGPESVTLYLVVPPSDISRTRPLSRATSETITSGPKDYSQVPKLGPRLPGDLGGPIVSAQQRGENVPVPPIGVGQPDPRVQAEEAARQRAERERDAARMSCVFLGGSGAGASAMPAMPNLAAAAPGADTAIQPAEATQGDQAAKRAFMAQAQPAHGQHRTADRAGLAQYRAGREHHPGCAHHRHPFRPSRPDHRPGDAECL